MSLHDLLSRALMPSPNRGFRGVGGGAAHLGTDIGLKREENQDRVAIVRWEHHEGQNRWSRCAVVVSDGMGGMQDGALCATLTVATFLAELLAGPGHDLSKIVKRAVEVANQAIFDVYRGRGGATLSAVVIGGNGEKIGVNVGDSRIYSVPAAAGSKIVDRLTVDDTLKDAFGSDNKDLLQFIGLGGGIIPNVFPIVDESGLLAITTDGAHFFDELIFSEILLRSPDPKAMAERIIALSRWLGAPDNATIATIDIGKMQQFLREVDSAGAEVWIGGSDGPIYVIQTRAVEPTVPSPDEASKRQSDLTLPASSQSEGVKKKKRANNKKPPSPDQLTIDVEVSNGSELNADR